MERLKASHRGLPVQACAEPKTLEPLGWPFECTEAGSGGLVQDCPDTTLAQLTQLPRWFLVWGSLVCRSGAKAVVR